MTALPELPKTPLVISFAAAKGGTGKTVGAVMSAAVLAEAGHRVRVIDADPQGSAWEWKEDAAEAGEPLPFEVTLNASRSLHRERDTLTASWDVVIIDCAPESKAHAARPGDAAMIMKSAIRASDIVLTPLQPSTLDLKRLQPLVDIVDDARFEEGRPIIHVTHFARVDRRTNHAKVFRDAIDAMETAPPVCATDIPLRSGYAYVGGTGIHDHKLKSLYRTLIAEVLELATTAVELSNASPDGRDSLAPTQEVR